jgi:Mg-chelatase subunit ChlD
MNLLSALLRKARDFLNDDAQDVRLCDAGADPLAYEEEHVVDELVIDVSLSMDEPDYPPSRLAGAQQAAIRFLDRRREANPKDFVGVVAFSRSARVVAAPMAVGEHVADLRHAIQSLSTSLCTNIAAGLRLGHREIARLRHPREPRILLLTDGHSNTGPNPEIEAGEVRQAGIQLDIIGIGGSPDEVNEPMLKRMASIVGGERRYWFIKSVGELVQKFEALALREIK